MPPRQVATIELRDQPGWVTFSMDGRYAYPSTGEIIDTATRTGGGDAHATKNGGRCRAKKSSRSRWRADARRGPAISSASVGARGNIVRVRMRAPRRRTPAVLLVLWTLGTAARGGAGARRRRAASSALRTGRLCPGARARAAGESLGRARLFSGMPRRRAPRSRYPERTRRGARPNRRTRRRDRRVPPCTRRTPPGSEKPRTTSS